MNIFYNFYNKRISHFVLITFLLFSFSSNIVSQINSADWNLNTATARSLTTLPSIPSTALSTTISIERFKQKLGSTKQEIQIPNPDGKFETFVIEPTNVVGSEVAHLYTIKTFKGYKKENPTVLFAGDISDNGFHAGIYAGRNTYFIEPTSTNSNSANHLKVYYKRESKANKIKCLVENTARQVVKSNHVHKRSAPNQKRNFRLAIVGTGEFGQAFGGTPYNATNALNALASGVNMINPIYLRDLGIDFTLVSTAAMVFEDPDTDDFDINDEDGFFEALNSTIFNAIGVNGFDIGHGVIWEDIGGLAAPGVCDDEGKAGGYSGVSSSTVTLWVDFVAHEIGHQFNADHNFVSTECGTSVDGLRYEPGEGSSIMAYAGVCGPPVEFANGSDPYFHYASIKTITDYLETINCATTTTNGNSSDPVSNAQSDITIPKQTPFVLVGSATDANDATGNLSYSWEQFDGSSNAVSGPPSCNSTNAPLFRFRPPNSTGIRSFPQYTDVLAGNNDQQWEKLPCAARDINFSLVVRDNNRTFGRVANDLMKIRVANTGPFEVTSPNGRETLTGNMASTITWTVNGTDAHCSNVDILLSTDGGGTYTLIADATPNDGTESVSIPNRASTNARIIIRCDVAGSFRSASTFYDVSNAAFTITEGTAQVVDVDMDGVAADVDCNDNNANIGARQTAGTSCNDGNANTENDVITANGCGCAGTAIVISACANNGGDADNDGICADVDCNDNDANIGAKQTAGTSCNDGNANTENDVITADGCGCAGTAIVISACANNGGDADNDGICADVDCNDNDANIGAKQTAGTSCNDGNANTENDVITADGCGCAGTAIVISACANNGGDADMDGVCADVDCDDNNASINPGAMEIPNNGIDDNCNGSIDEGNASGTGSCAPITSTLTTSSIGDNNAYIYTPQPNGAVNNQFRYRIKGNATWIVTNISNNYFRYLSDLMAGSEYEFQVSQACADGTFSQFSASSFFTTTGQAQGGGGNDNTDNSDNTDSPTTGSCAPISGNLTTSSIRDNDGYIYTPQPNGAIDNQFRYRPNGSGDWQLTDISTNYFRYLSGLMAGTEYEFQVSQVCADGNFSQFSTSSFFTTTGESQGSGNTDGNSGDSNCASVEADKLYVSSVSATAAYVYTPQPLGANNNQFRYRQVGMTPWKETDVSTLYYRYLSDLNRGTTYEYQVRQECSAGVWSSYSDSFRFITTTSFQNDSDGPIAYATFLKLSTSSSTVAEIKLAPNPVVNELVFRLNQPYAAGAIIRVYNISGKLTQVLPLQLGASKTIIDVSSLQSGIYFLEYKTASLLKTAKFIKR